MRVCHACNAPVEGKFIGRADECVKCGADLHACINCRFYDERMGRSCREPQAEPPREKARANFCDYFEFDEAGPKGADSEAERAKAAFEALFGGKK